MGQNEIIRTFPTKIKRKWKSCKYRHLSREEWISSLEGTKGLKAIQNEAYLCHKPYWKYDKDRGRQIQKTLDGVEYREYQKASSSTHEEDIKCTQLSESNTDMVNYEPAPFFEYYDDLHDKTDEPWDYEGKMKPITLDEPVESDKFSYREYMFRGTRFVCREYDHPDPLGLRPKSDHCESCVFYAEQPQAWGDHGGPLDCKVRNKNRSLAAKSPRFAHY
jgi:hypothetical protein